MNCFRNQQWQFTGRALARRSVIGGVLCVIVGGSIAADDGAPHGFRARESNPPIAPVIVPGPLPMPLQSGEPAILPGVPFPHTGANRSTGLPSGLGNSTRRPLETGLLSPTGPIIAPSVDISPPASLSGGIEIVPREVRSERSRSRSTYQIVPREPLPPSHPAVQILPAPQGSEFYELPAPPG